MEKQEATLQGDRYWGRFSASKQKTEGWVGSEYTEAKVDFYFWQGEGIIEDTSTSEAHRFFFTTPKRESVRQSLGQLENEIVRIERGVGRETNPPIVEKKAVYDFVLRQMYEDARKGEKTEIIPKVNPKALKYKELLIRSLVADEKTGQMGLHLRT